MPGYHEQGGCSHGTDSIYHVIDAPARRRLI